MLTDGVNSQSVSGFAGLRTHWTLVAESTDVSLHVFLDCVAQFAAVVTLGTLPYRLPQHWVVGGDHQLAHLSVKLALVGEDLSLWVLETGGLSSLTSSHDLSVRHRLVGQEPGDVNLVVDGSILCLDLHHLLAVVTSHGDVPCGPPHLPDRVVGHPLLLGLGFGRGGGVLLDHHIGGGCGVSSTSFLTLALSQTLDPKFTPGRKQSFQVALGHLSLSGVDKVEDGLKVLKFDSFKIDQRMIMLMFPQKSFEEVTGSREHKFVSRYLMILAC